MREERFVPDVRRSGVRELWRWIWWRCCYGSPDWLCALSKARRVLCVSSIPTPKRLVDLNLPVVRASVEVFKCRTLFVLPPRIPHRACQIVPIRDFEVACSVLKYTLETDLSQ